jgi:hypothetical protein
VLSLCLLTLQLLGVPWVGQELPLQRIAGRQVIAEADDRELLRLTRTYGTPWLIVEPEEGQLQGNWHARVYLQPDAVDAPVRRGRLLHFSARTALGYMGYTGAKAWQVDLSAYAQIPSGVPGSFTSTAQDLPFVEFHRLPDADLLSLVAFVRSSPSVPERSNPTGTLVRINGRMPIQFIRRGEGNDLEVAVMQGLGAMWVLTVRQDKGTWRAVSVYFVIA